MAGPKDTFPAQRRNAVIAQFTDSIQSAPPGKKAELGQYMGTLQSELVGMTGLQAYERISKAVLDMKAIVKA